MSPEQIMQKLAKLKATEVSLRDGGNVEAAESYAAKVAELLLRHQISMCDVEQSVRDQDDPIEESYSLGDKRSRVLWEERLASVIARANSCEILMVQGTNTIYFVGRKTNREVTVYLFEYLRNQITAYAKKERQRKYNWVKNHEPWNIDVMKGWKASFLKGVVFQLKQRFDEMAQGVADEVGADTMALVKADRALVKNAVDEITNGRQAKSLNGQANTNQDGFDSGKTFGASVAISRGVSSDGSGPKQLS